MICKSKRYNPIMKPSHRDTQVLLLGIFCQRAHLQKLGASGTMARNRVLLVVSHGRRILNFEFRAQALGYNQTVAIGYSGEGLGFKGFWFGCILLRLGPYDIHAPSGKCSAFCYGRRPIESNHRLRDGVLVRNVQASIATVPQLSSRTLSVRSFGLLCQEGLGARRVRTSKRPSVFCSVTA